MHTKCFGVLLVLALLVSCESMNNALPEVNSSKHSPAKSSEGKESSAQAKNDQARHNASQAPLVSMSPKLKKETIDTTAGIEYLTDSEKSNYRNKHGTDQPG